MKAILGAIVLSLVLVGSSIAAEQVTPRERTLTRQVSTLKSQVRTLKARNSQLKTQVASLNGQVSTLTTERDTWIVEAGRLRGLIVSEIHGLANSWRTDGNPKTDVNYYEADNYWSYSFTWCGFC